MRAKGSFKYVLLIIPDLKKCRRQKVPSEPVSGFFTQMRPLFDAELIHTRKYNVIG